MTTAQGTRDIIVVWSLTGFPGVGGRTSLKTRHLFLTHFLTASPDAVQKGSTGLISTGGGVWDVAYRDGKLWSAENTQCKPAGDSIQRCCTRYVEVLTAGLSVNQDFDLTTNGAYNFDPSVDLDSSDNLMTSFTQSSINEFPSAYIAGRKDSDPINTIGTPVLIQGGTAAYTGNRNFWGGSAAGVDPSDETVIWLAAEYTTSGATPNWGTWIASASLAATSTGSGQMQIAPHKLEFGSVKLNSTRSRHFKVKNTGSGEGLDAARLDPFAPIMDSEQSEAEERHRVPVWRGHMIH